MTRSLFVTASAGAGKTFRLTQEVRRHIECDGVFVVAATFTRAAAAEMEKRIHEQIGEGPGTAAEKLALTVRAAKVHFSTIDSLFHQFLATEETVPQIADEHEQALIIAAADERFFRDPRVVEDIENILIAARTLNLPPERLLAALDEGREALAAWKCPETRLDALKATQNRLTARYEELRTQVRVAAETAGGNLRRLVAEPLLAPLSAVDVGKALFVKRSIGELPIAGADRQTPSYAALEGLYPPMRRLVAEHLLNTKRLRSALLKRFSALRTEALAAEKARLGRIFFEDIPQALAALDGPGSSDRPLLMARLYELGFHRTAHLLLDEFQDTSRLQFELLRPLADEILACVGENAEGERSLFLVGDWKQSIYGWRGAAPDHLRSCIAPALSSGQLATEILPCNHRSTPLLIGFFNHLVEALFAGTDRANLQIPPETRKRPYSGLSEIAAIPVPCSSGDAPLYGRLVEAIRQRRAEEGCAWGDLAVLCRTNAHMDQVAASLADAGIPTSGIRGRELLSLREGVALWLALASLFTDHDGRFIPNALKGLEYGEAMAKTLEQLAVRIGTASRPQGFAALAAALSGLAPHFPRVLTEALWDEAQRYFSRPDAGDAGAFTAYLQRMSSLVTVPEGEHADRVKLATIHGTKGIEFRHVFLLWKEAGDRLPEVPDPGDGCPLLLTKAEFGFLAAGPAPEATEIAMKAASARNEKAGETANLLYVAATRAVRSLTILLKADQEGNLKGFGEKLHAAALQPIPETEWTGCGWRRNYGPEECPPCEYGTLLAPDLAGAIATEPGGEELDPALVSAAVEAGIARGLRIHAAIARLAGDHEAFDRSSLTAEESAAVERFLSDPGVRSLLFRPGRVLTEQHVSDTRSFGIVDRLILADDRITLVDFKTGRVGHLAEKYRQQLSRYRIILQGLFGDRPIEAYLMFVDEPQKIVAV
jgi:ATP-dependent exoDNAse (exonuclease V) beta subunit